MKKVLFIIIIISFGVLSGCVEQQVSITDTQIITNTLTTVTLEGTTISLRFQDGTGFVAKESTPDDARGMYGTLLTRIDQTITIKYFFSEEINGFKIRSVS